MRLFYLSQRKKDGVWYAAFRDPVTGEVGNKRSTRTDSKRQAETIAQTWLRDGIPDAKKSNKVVFCEYLKNFWDFDTSNYFKERITLGKQPHRRYAKDMQDIVIRYFEGYYENILLCQITEENLQDFLINLRINKGLAADTVNKARNAACIALRYAKRKNIIKSFNFDAVLRASGEIKERGILEREEVESIFAAEWRDPRSRLVCLIASQTGMRMGEIQALRFCDIHEKKIDVIHSWSKIDGGLKSTKNKERRQVPILPELYNELERYIKKYHKIYKVNSLLFSGSIEDIPYDNKQIKKDFFKALRDIGISEKERKDRNIVFHSWRHYCAKNLAQVTNRAIGMAILGHKTSAMFDHYAGHVDKETFDKMTQAIEEGLKPGSKEKKPLPFPSAVNG
jgi:integrase